MLYRNFARNRQAKPSSTRIGRKFAEALKHGIFLIGGRSVSLVCNFDLHRVVDPTSFKNKAIPPIGKTTGIPGQPRPPDKRTRKERAADGLKLR
ncbi:hypothetical protein WH297_25200 [Ochrobactrum vermis]|uniref:Transposase n=1 Tax=Ochrobactrum vermis TaxID=1827297 RepID=A0ABU8PLV1_9HYPH|nr:hypothetical protein [Ochrobactrum vermis]